MSGEDDFRPVTGRIGNAGSASGRRFSKRVGKVAAKLARPTKASGFTGARIGLGAVAGRMVPRRVSGLSGQRMRRVMVKVHIARAATGGRAAFSAHVSYLKRDGVERDGQGGELYTAKESGIDAREFLDRSASDRHQFRIIVSPEDGDQIGDLKETTRALMSRMQDDLGVRLDWVAVDHHNTGYPHTHIVLRGKDHFGRDLVIARDYLTKGLRGRAQDIVTERLGPRRDVDIIRARHSEVSRDRFTGLDRALVERSRNGLVELDPGEGAGGRFERALLLRRLKHLQGLAMAEKLPGQKWRLSEELETSLKALGRRGDIVRTLAASRSPEKADQVRDFALRQADAAPLLGEVIGSGPVDELRDRRFLLVRSFDRHVWKVDAGAVEPGSLPPDGAIVEVSAASTKQRMVDRTISQIAARNGGTYSEALHERTEPESRSAYRLAHKRRLEALRRAGIVERTGDGSWTIPADYAQRASQYDRQQHGTVRIETRSWIGLEQQISHAGATWMDEASPVAGEAGSSRLSDARKARLDHLRKNGLLGRADNGLTRTQLDQLKSAELETALQKIAGSRPDARVKRGAIAYITGVYERPLDLAAGRYALVANAKEFMLVPWRPDLERRRGMTLSATLDHNRLSWTFGRSLKRGLSR